MDWQLTDHALQLTTPLRTSKGVISKRDILVLRAEQDGVIGYGEASPLPGYGGEDIEHSRALLQQLPADAGAAMALAQSWSNAPCASAAVLGALADLTAHKRKLPLATSLAAALGQRPCKYIGCNALLPHPEEAYALPLAAAGFQVFKWKSSGNISKDVQTAIELRRSLGPKCALRIDANGAWSIADTKAFAEGAREANIDYVEQPLPVGDEAALAELTDVQCRVALDESLRTLDDIQRLCAEAWAEVLIIKPQWLGGFPALRSVQTYATMRHPRRIVVTSALDGAVGRAHAVHASAALNLNGEHHGLATGSFITNDIATGLEPAAGRISLTSQPGLGLSYAVDADVE